MLPILEGKGVWARVFGKGLLVGGGTVTENSQNHW